ncbi:hypothetical protein E4U31_006061 [Claviceps sp. LM219 group G6]|nr:hypothetical protein E4U31_006061 [Claviceps sp. LM219 group G6]
MVLRHRIVAGEQNKSYDKLAPRPSTDISCSLLATRGMIAYQLTRRSDQASQYANIEVFFQLVAYNTCMPDSHDELGKFARAVWS